MAIGSIAELLFRARGDTDDAQREFRELKNEASGSFKAIKSESDTASTAIGSFIGNLGASVVQEFTAQLVQGAKAVFDYTARMEQTKVGFTTLMGGAAQANKHLKDLQKFAQETPFEFESLTTASRRLQNVGLEAEKVIPVMRDIGNAAAAAGASSEDLDSISLAFSQIIAKGKLSAEEVNQLAERGIPVWRMLSEELGKSKEEIIKLSEQGKISSDVFLNAFQRFSQANFGDAMEKQSRTFAGAMSTIKGITMQTAATAFQPLYDQISKFAVNVALSLSQQQKQANEAGISFGQSLGTAIGVGIQQSGVGSDGYWNSIFFGPSAIKKIAEASYEFGKTIAKGAREGFNEGFAQTGTSPSGAELIYDALTNTVVGGTAPVQPPGSHAPAAAPEKVKTTDIYQATQQGDFDKRHREFLEKQAKEAVRAAEAEMRQTLDIYRAGYAKRLAELEQRFGLEKRTLKEHVRDVGRIHEEAIQDEIRQNQELLRNANLTAEDRKKISNRIAVLELELQTQRIKNSNAVVDAINKETEAEKRKAEETKKANDELEREIELGLKKLALEIEKEREEERRKYEAQDPTGQGTILGGIADAAGVSLISIFGGQDQMLSEAEFIKSVWTDLNGHIGGAIGNMVQGLGQMAAAWIATGKFSAKAALQMASSIALSLAMQAGVAAIMEVARGWAESAAAAASFAVGDFAGGALHSAAATMHFSAAAIYGTVAGVAGAVGVGLGLASRAFKDESSGAFGSSSSSSGSASRNTAGQGGYYSGYGDDVTVIESGVNQATPVSKVIVDIRPTEAFIVDTVVENVNNNGKLRTTIQDA